MTKATELAQLGGLVDVTGSGTATKVGIGTTVDISGGLSIKGTPVISNTGVWQGSSAGIQGAQGTTGTQGITGTQGTTGPQGTQGITGSQGITGTQGATGTQGTTGAQGATGTQGTTGAQGTTGTQGTLGTQGATGPVGGSSGQVLYNSGGTATSSSNLTFDGTNLFCGGTIRTSNTNIDPSNVGSGFAAGNIGEPSTGFSAPGICFGTGAGQHGAIVYGSGLMYFGSENGSDNTMQTMMTLSNTGTLSFNSGYGSNAVAYACRAWVNYNGSGASIRGSGNISSVTKNGTGSYTLNFGSAMPDVNYSSVATITPGGALNPLVPTIAGDGNGSYSTTQLTITTWNQSSTSLSDTARVCVSIFR